MGGLAFLAAIAVLTWVVRPIGTDTVGFDSAASVLYFDRIVAGRHLEAFVGTTPKPLLTLVYGLVHALVPDWRAISWLAILACALGISLSAVLAHRVAGVIAATFVTIGLLGSTQLLQDVGLAYSVTWALLFWAAAGVAVSGARPRWPLGGVLLLAANLVRVEALLVPAVTIAAIVVALLTAPDRASRWRDLRAPLIWIGLVPLLALPVQGIHDFLLTGDPLYSQYVPIRASQGATLRDVPWVFAYLIRHYLAIGALSVLALIGAVHLVRTRRWAIVVALLALGPGVAAALVLLALRHIYISDRYIAAADLAAIFAAAIGVASIRVPALDAIAAWLARWPARTATLGIVIAASAVAVAVASPFAPVNSSVRVTLHNTLAVHEHLDANLPVLAAAMDAIPGVRTFPAGGDGRAGEGSTTRLMVPVLLTPQVAVDLGLPLNAIRGTAASHITTDGSYPAPGVVVYHDQLRDSPAEPFAIFEVGAPVVDGAIRVVPVKASPAIGTWVVRIDRN